MYRVKDLNPVDERAKSQVLNLIDSAFPHNKFIGVNLANGVWHDFAGSNAKTKVLSLDGLIVSVAVYTERKVNFKGQILKALTVGPVATLPKFWGYGYSSAVMKAIETDAINLNADIIYIQGIDNYYSKFGYFPYLAKSKIVLIKFPDQLNANATVEPLTPQDLKMVMEFYNSQTLNINLRAIRDEKLWSWLLTYGCNTNYFFQPRKITLNEEMIGYFTSDPLDPINIRECILKNEDEYISISLNLIKKELACEKVTINTYLNSYLYNYAKKYTNSTFVENIKSDGGSLLKIINLNKLLSGYQVTHIKEHPPFNVLFIEYNILYRVQIKNHYANFTKLCLNSNKADFEIEGPLPSLIFGYLKDSCKIKTISSNIHQDILKNIFSNCNNNCFVFQGDNF